MGSCYNVQTHSDTVDIAMTNINGIWQFQGDNGGWISMNQHDSNNIRAAHQAQKRKYQFTQWKYLYEIDFNKMTQTNTTTSKSRLIRYHIAAEAQHDSESDADHLDVLLRQIDDNRDEKEDTESFDTCDIEDGGYQWQFWLSDNNKWCNYDRDKNDRLECCYLAQQNSCAIEINNNIYEVDLVKKEQINVNTFAKCKIRRKCSKDTDYEKDIITERVDIELIEDDDIKEIITERVDDNEEDDTKVQHQWQCWLSDKRVWCDYDTQHNAQLEQCHESNQSICDLTMHNNRYKVDLDTMKQTNVRTNVCRSIQRISVHIIKETNYIWWEWKDNDKKYKRYPKDVSDELEAIHMNEGINGASVIKTFGSQCYEIKPLQLKQINKATQFSRAIRRVNINEDNNDEDEGIALWQYKDDGEIWKNYDTESNKYIESKYKMRDEKVVLKIGTKRVKYEIDLKELTQINAQTKNKRYVRRKQVNSEDDLMDGQRDDINLWKGPLRKTYGDEIKTAYHITGEEAAKAINKSKRMIRGKDGMFGGGIYLAETKEDAQYKSENKGGWLITAKLFSGKAMILNHGNAGKYDFNSLSAAGFDSIYAPKGGGSGKPEWCVFNWDQVLVLNVAKM